MSFLHGSAIFGHGLAFFQTVSGNPAPWAFSQQLFAWFLPEDLDISHFAKRHELPFEVNEHHAVYGESHDFY